MNLGDRLLAGKLRLNRFFLLDRFAGFTRGVGRRHLSLQEEVSRVIVRVCTIRAVHRSRIGVFRRTGGGLRFEGIAAAVAQQVGDLCMVHDGAGGQRKQFFCRRRQNDGAFGAAGIEAGGEIRFRQRCTHSIRTAIGAALHEEVPVGGDVASQCNRRARRIRPGGRSILQRPAVETYCLVGGVVQLDELVGVHGVSAAAIDVRLINDDAGATDGCRGDRFFRHCREGNNRRGEQPHRQCRSQRDLPRPSIHSL